LIQFCCFFWCFAHAAISAAEKVIDFSALFLEMLNLFFQYLEYDNDESESDHEHLSEEDSDHQESENNWDSKDENYQEVEDSSEVEDNQRSSTFNEIKARLRQWSRRAARSKRAARSRESARSVIFDCSAWVVDFLHLLNALEKVRRSSRDRFWLRRWDIWNKNDYKNIRNVNKQRGLNSFNFGQLRGDEVDFWISSINGSSWGRAKMNVKDSKPFCIR